ncbi:hypothetical protein LJC55_01360 [Eubacteriales bacterium OttesenSCG-928-N14]|nr:hypothetical protein [Eubacteriales bacterium OttesenSCG-928-N14]
MQEQSKTATTSQGAAPKKKKSILPVILVVILLLAAAAGAYFLLMEDSPVDDLMKAIRANDAETAKQIYDEQIVSYIQDSQAAVTEVLSYANFSYDEYNSGTITYEQLQTRFATIDAIGIEDYRQDVVILFEDEYQAIKDKTETLKASKDAFDAAKGMEQSKPLDAVVEYIKVIEEDKQYSQMLQNVAAIKDAAIAELKERTTQMVADGDAAGAARITNTVAKALDDASVTTLQGELNEQAGKQLIAQLDALRAAGKYDELNALVNENASIDSAEYQAKVTALKPLLQVYAFKANIEVAKLANYDVYSIVPDGFNPNQVTLTANRNIEPWIAVQGDRVTLNLEVGTKVADPLAITNATFSLEKMPGSTATVEDVAIAVSQNDRNQQLMADTTYMVWFTVRDIKQIDALVKLVQTYQGEGASAYDNYRATLAFTPPDPGLPEGQSSHRITNQERENLQQMYDLYQLLKADPALFDVLKP